MKQLYELAVNKPVIVTIGLVTLLMLGTISVYKLPVEFFPEMDPREMSIGFDHSKLRFMYDEETTKKKLQELVANAEALQKCIYLAEKGLPMLYIPLNAGGVNSPATTAGCMASMNAGILLGIVLSQLIRPGAPLAVPGWNGGPYNLKTMVGNYVLADEQGVPTGVRAERVDHAFGPAVGDVYLRGDGVRPVVRVGGHERADRGGFDRLVLGRTRATRRAVSSTKRCRRSSNTSRHSKSMVGYRFARLCK